MLERHRAFLRRVGTFIGLAVMVYALYRAVTPPPNHCRHSTPQIGYACDVGPSSHPHSLLWLLVAVGGLAVVVASRRFFAYFED